MKSYFSKSSHVEKEDNSILSDIAKDPLRTGNGIRFRFRQRNGS